MSYVIPKRVLDALNYDPDFMKRLNETYSREPAVPPVAEGEPK